MSPPWSLASLWQHRFGLSYGCHQRDQKHISQNVKKKFWITVSTYFSLWTATNLAADPSGVSPFLLKMTVAMVLSVMPMFKSISRISTTMRRFSLRLKYALSSSIEIFCFSLRLIYRRFFSRSRIYGSLIFPQLVDKSKVTVDVTF